MGQDVASIGLRHDLPVDDPYELLRVIAKRLNRNVKLVVREEYQFFFELMMITSLPDWEFIELGRIQVHDSDDYLLLIFNDYQALCIRNLVGPEGIHRILRADDFSELCFSPLNEPDRILYEIESDSLYYRIYQNNISLSTYASERWNWWSDDAKQGPNCSQFVHNYRRALYEEAQMFGCKEVIICSDQGVTISVYWSLELSPEELKRFAESREYLDEQDYPCSGLSKDDWLRYGKQIYFPDYLSGRAPLLQGKEFIELIYDDFADLIAAKHITD